MKEYPKIRRIGDNRNDGILKPDEEYLTVQEKLDGANFRFTYDRETDRLVFGSRNIEYWNDGNQPIERSERLKFKFNSILNKLPRVSLKDSPQNDSDKSFRHAIDYVRENIDMDEVRRLDEVYDGLTFFGEAMHPHTIDYYWEETPSFIGFDVYSDKFNGFGTHPDVERFFDLLGFETAPTYPLDVVKDGFDCPESNYYDGPAEGVVVKNDLSGQRAKIRGEKFKEVFEANRSSSGVELHDVEWHGQYLADCYATDARILKQIHKYDDRGRTIEMEMMEDLWRDVFDDILQEEYEEILLGNFSIRTKKFRSAVASNTATVLQQYMNRPDDSVLNEAPA